MKNQRCHPDARKRDLFHPVFTPGDEQSASRIVSRPHLSILSKRPSFRPLSSSLNEETQTLVAVL